MKAVLNSAEAEIHHREKRLLEAAGASREYHHLDPRRPALAINPCGIPLKFPGTNALLAAAAQTFFPFIPKTDGRPELLGRFYRSPWKCGRWLRTFSHGGRRRCWTWMFAFMVGW